MVTLFAQHAAFVSDASVVLSAIVIPLPARESKDTAVSVRCSARVQYGGALSVEVSGSNLLLGDVGELGDGDRREEEAAGTVAVGIMPLLLDSVVGPPSIGG